MAKKMILEKGDNGPETISFDDGKTAWRLCWIRAVNMDTQKPDIQFIDHSNMIKHVAACEKSGVIFNPPMPEDK